MCFLELTSLGSRHSQFEHWPYRWASNIRYASPPMFKPILGGGRYYGCKGCSRHKPKAPKQLNPPVPLPNSFDCFLIGTSFTEKERSGRSAIETRRCNISKSFLFLSETFAFYLNMPLGLGIARSWNFPVKIGCLEGGVMCASCFITPPLFLQANLSPP